MKAHAAQAAAGAATPKGAVAAAAGGGGSSGAPSLELPVAAAAGGSPNRDTAGTGDLLSPTISFAAGVGGLDLPPPDQI